MSYKKMLCTMLCALLALSAVPVTAQAVRPLDTVDQSVTTEPFYDDFEGDSLDTGKWLIAEKAWGGYNGGVVPENVSVSGGTLKLEGHGNLYTGDVLGVNREPANGIRTGAAIATRQYYASGSYEVVAKVAPELGACSAIWTFEYEEYEQGVDPEYENYPDQTGKYAIVNHEIDIELPTGIKDGDEPSFQAARFNTYVMENRYNPEYHPLPENVADGQWHTFRFDWHTGDEDQQPRVEFYVDGQHLYTSYEYIPTNASRLWLGIWFPTGKDTDNDGYYDSGWAGTADFDTTVFEIDSVSITPFCEAGDTVGVESYPKSGWADNSFPEDALAEDYEHVVNGDFSQGGYGWTLEGEAQIADGRAVLATGGVTRTVLQQISVQPQTTYTLKADVETSGTAVTLGARKLNGEGDTSQTYTSSGEKAFTFTTPVDCRDMVVYVQVERYQEGEAATADDISVRGGDHTGDTGDQVEETPSPSPDPTPAPAASLLDENGWETSGGAVMEAGTATLSSGDTTDRASQILKIQGGKTYTLTADVESSGTEVEIGVNDYDGRYTNIMKTTTQTGPLSLTFTVADYMEQIEVYLQVLRYQTSETPVKVENIRLVEGAAQDETVLPDTGDSEDTADPQPPETTEPQPTPSEPLAQDMLDAAAWQRSGGAVVADGLMTLASGADTDRVWQPVKVEGGRTYVLSAQVQSTGAVAEVGVNDYDGRYTNIAQTTDQDGTVIVTFTTISYIDTIEVYLQVLRYQQNEEPVTISNVTLTPVD